MPVIKRKLPPQPSTPAPTPISDDSPFKTAKETEEYLKCSHHEVRELERAGIIKPIPYLNGRIKPRRYLRADLDKHIAQQVRKVEAA